jgi:hypothetical protein
MGGDHPGDSAQIIPSPLPVDGVGRGGDLTSIAT